VKGGTKIARGESKGGVKRLFLVDQVEKKGTWNPLRYWVACPAKKGGATYRWPKRGKAARLLRENRVAEMRTSRPFGGAEPAATGRKFTKEATSASLKKLLDSEKNTLGSRRGRCLQEKKGRVAAGKKKKRGDLVRRKKKKKHTERRKRIKLNTGANTVTPAPWCRKKRRHREHGGKIPQCFSGRKKDTDSFQGRKEGLRLHRVQSIGSEEADRPVEDSLRRRVANQSPALWSATGYVAPRRRRKKTDPQRFARNAAGKQKKKGAFSQPHKVPVRRASGAEPGLHGGIRVNCYVRRHEKSREKGHRRAVRALTGQTHGNIAQAQ